MKNNKEKDDSIKFTKEEKETFLKKNGYKIETHKVFAFGIGTFEHHADMEIAIPINEVFDSKIHKSVDTTFKKILEQKRKDEILGN